jgi:hypothetical protein
MSDSDIDKQIEDLLNQVAYRGYVAGQHKDTGNAENLYIQSEIVVERATTAIQSIISTAVREARIELLERLRLPSIATIDIPDGGVFKRPSGQEYKPSVYEDVYRQHYKNIEQILAQHKEGEAK